MVLTGGGGPAHFGFLFHEYCFFISLPLSLFPYHFPSATNMSLALALTLASTPQEPNQQSQLVDSYSHRPDICFASASFSEHNIPHLIQF